MAMIMRMIGLIPIAARPFHAGHNALINIASSECDAIEIYAANASSRGCVNAEAMHDVWEQCILPRAPWSALVHFTNNPVLSVYERLKRSDAETDERFSIYGDAIDVAANFPDERLRRNAPCLSKRSAIVRRPIERSSTIDISGTIMRGWLANGNAREFVEHLPGWMDKQLAWKLLRSRVTA